MHMGKILQTAVFMVVFIKQQFEACICDTLLPMNKNQTNNQMIII